MAQNPEEKKQDEQPQEVFLQDNQFRGFIEQLRPLFQAQGWRLRPFRFTQYNVLKKLPKNEIWWCKGQGRFGLPAILFKVGKKHIFRNTTRINGLFDFMMGVFLVRNQRRCQIHLEPYGTNGKFEYCGRCFYHFCIPCKERLRRMTDEQGRNSDCAQCPNCRRPLNIVPPNQIV